MLVRRWQCSPSPTHSGLPVCRSNSVYSARKLSSGSLNSIRTGICRSLSVLLLRSFSSKG
ncbi:hypothetical protein MGSAQ_001597 [marine sediment metagenome]|uniref:Uncharacterized protein n=1 Tax=marine sediment metagenome TaxID=412755 RepID=A0A1B6NTV1_9ZZZZ